MAYDRSTLLTDLQDLISLGPERYEDWRTRACKYMNDFRNQQLTPPGDTILNFSELRSGAASMLAVYVEQLQLTLCSNHAPSVVYAGCEPKYRQGEDTDSGMYCFTQYAFGVHCMAMPSESHDNARDYMAMPR